MGATTDNRRRVLLHMVLGIGLPCLVLALLAMRGVRNDSALIEQERLAAHRAILDDLTKGVADRLNAAEEAASRLVVELPVGARVSTDAAAGLKTDHPVIREVFVVEGGTIQVVGAPLLYHAADGGAPVPPLLESLALGENLEFVAGDLERALIEYKEAFVRATSQRARVEALGALARVQRKSGRREEAVATYRRIALKYADQASRGGLPWGIVARIECLDLQAGVPDAEAVVGDLASIYEELLASRWSLDDSQYAFVVTELNRIVGRLPPGLTDESIKALRQRAETAQLRTAALLALVSAVTAELRSGGGTGRRAGWSPGPMTPAT